MSPVLIDLRGHLMVRRQEFVPTRTQLAALAFSDVIGEIFHVDLLACPVGSEHRQADPAFLDDKGPFGRRRR